MAMCSRVYGDINPQFMPPVNNCEFMEFSQHNPNGRLKNHNVAPGVLEAIHALDSIHSNSVNSCVISSYVNIGLISNCVNSSVMLMWL
jgi:hypothetical protein